MHMSYFSDSVLSGFDVTSSSIEYERVKQDVIGIIVSGFISFLVL